MMNFKAICFDMDGTLIDRNAGALNNYKQLLRWDIPEISDEELEALAKYLLKYDKHGSVEKEEIFTHYQEIEPRAKKEIQEYIDYWYEYTGIHTVAYKDTYEVLIALRERYQLILLTNGTIVGQRKKIQQMDFESYFDEVYVSEEIGYQKPDVRTFQYVIGQTGLDPDDIAYVGDHIVNDMMGSKKAGMTSILVSVRTPNDLSNVDFWVSNLGELKRLLLG
ncbi:MAG: HAD family hydrolase [Erysipelothrix sp.]|nr:HAD family hydrolase [Erysipelothrix sp.]